MNKNKSFVEIVGQYALHPFLMAVYPILFLLSNNISQINPNQALRPLTISLVVASTLAILLGLAARNIRQGAFSVTLFLTLFFTYGHVFRWLEENMPSIASHLLLGSLWLALLVLGLWAKYKISNVGMATAYLNIVLLFLLFQPVTNIAAFLLTSNVPEEVAPPSPFDGIQSTPQETQDLPDIYYIILDGYGRTDVIKELFDYDNSDFIDGLKARGFYVAEQSHSNYMQTALSLSSSTNLNYLNNLEEMGIQTDDRSLLRELIHQSQLRIFLEEKGYKTVAFTTPYDPTNITNADIYFSYNTNLVNDLEGLILVTSATRAMGDRVINLFVPMMCEPLRNGVLNVFQNLRRVPELPGPKFVFVHVMSPHPPFVFDAQGNPVQFGHCEAQDGNYFWGGRENYAKGYPQQLAYISTLTLEVVDDILAKSTTPPIIIIQGDHGSGMLLDYSSMENTCLRERAAILNAYYIPDAKQDLLYPSVTPVNTFRVVLNEAFGLDLPLLDDRTYYSTWDQPYQVTDVTTMIEPACSK